MKTLPQKVNRSARSFEAAVVVIACLAAGSACGGADFEIASIDGGADASVGVDAHEKDGRAPDARVDDTGTHDTGVKDTGVHSDGSSGHEASVDAPDDVGPPKDGVAPGDAAKDVQLDALHDAIVTDDGPKVCPAGALSCTASGSTCPVSKFPQCATSACDNGCCTSAPAAQGTTCSEMGGIVCNGMGACVECIRADQCPPPSTNCVVPACSASNTCSFDPAPINTSCTDSGGKLCNGSGNCVRCTATNTSACTGSTPYCGAAGACVQCLTNAECGSGLESCNNGTCVLL